jgi:hypothetical protein
LLATLFADPTAWCATTVAASADPLPAILRPQAARARAVA